MFCFSLLPAVDQFLENQLQNKGSIYPSLSIKELIIRAILVHLQTVAPAYRKFKTHTSLHLSQKIHKHTRVYVCAWCQPLLI